MVLLQGASLDVSSCFVPNRLLPPPRLYANFSGRTLPPLIATFGAPVRDTVKVPNPQQKSPKGYIRTPEKEWGNAGLEPALDRPKRPVLTLTLIPLI